METAASRGYSEVMEVGSDLKYNQQHSFPDTGIRNIQILDAWRFSFTYLDTVVTEEIGQKTSTGCQT